MPACWVPTWPTAEPSAYGTWCIWDAVLPKPGESWSSTHAGTSRNARITAAQGHYLQAFPAPDPSVFGLSDADHAWVQRRQTPNPGGPYTQVLDFDQQRVASVPLPLINCTSPPWGTIDVSRLRMVDPKF